MISAKADTGRFTILHPLGEGSVGNVYLAFDREREIKVALKFLKKGGDESQGAFFKHEVRILSMLSHVGLAKIYDFFERDRDSEPFYSMEFIEGKPLGSPGEVLSAEQAVRSLIQLATALHYLHSNQVLHRDLKPSNVMLTPNGDIKLLDFGLSSTNAQFSQDSGLRGTLAYLAPEAYRSEIGPMTDLFGLGALFYECLTGRLPYSRPLSGSLSTVPEPPSLKTFRPDLPPYLGIILHRLLRLLPSERPSSALAVKRYLERQAYGTISDSSAGLLSPTAKLPLVGREGILQEWKNRLHQRPTGGNGPWVLTVTGPTGSGRSRFIEECRWVAQLAGLAFREVSASQTLRTGFPNAEHWEQSEGSAAFTDLHRWESASLTELRNFLALAIHFPRLRAILLEYDQDLVSPALNGFLASLSNLASHQTLTVAPLEDSLVRRMLEHASHEVSLPPEKAALILKNCGGMPALIVEALQKGTDVPVPQNFKEAAEAKWHSLSQPTRRLLALLVSNREFVELNAGQLLYEGSEEEFIKAVRELDAAGILKPRDAQNAILELTSPSLKRAYAEILDSEELNHAHRRWVEVSPAGTDVRALAEHAQRAGPEGLALKWGLEAASLDQNRGNRDSAIAWYQSTLALTRNPTDLALIYAKLSHLQYLAGDFAAALQSYDLWLNYRQDDESRLQRLKYYFYTGLTHYSAGNLEEAKSRLDQGLKLGNAERFPSHGPFLARCSGLLAAIEEKSGNFEAASSLLAAAVRLSGKDPFLLGEMERRRGDFAMHRLSFEDAARHFSTAADHYHQLDIGQGEAICRHSLALIFQKQGRLNEALPLFKYSIDQARKSGEMLQWARYFQNLALWHLGLGQYSEAEKIMVKTEAMLGLLGTDLDKLTWRLNHLALLVYSGNWQRLDSQILAIEAAQAELKRVGLWADFLYVKAEAAQYRGKWERAEGLYRQSRDAAVSEGQGDFVAIHSAIGVCRAALRRGVPATAIELLDPTVKTLATIPGSHFRLWERLLSLLGKPSESRTPEDFVAFIETARTCERIESQIEGLALLSFCLAGTKDESLAPKLNRAANQLLDKISKFLMEEMRMDFEKNRKLPSLDETLKGFSFVAENAVPTPPPDSHRGQVGEVRFRQFTEINLQIAKQTQLGAVLERVMDAAIELTGADRGFILLRHEGTNDSSIPGFQVETARHIQRRSLSQDEFNLSMTAVRQVLQTGNFLLTDDAQLDPRFSEKNSVLQYRLRSILVSPLEIEGEVIGTIYLDHNKANCFTEEDVMLLKAFSAQAALAIEKARMLQELSDSQKKLASQVESQAKHIQVLTSELHQIREDLKYEYHEIVGQSQPMMKVLQLLDHVTDTSIPVWIFGESGTGKELIARSLHYNSSRRESAFVTENVSTIPETLLESELFGHKRGAFTHADRDRIGLFEQASGGTLFLDEIADMSLGMQAKLLRVLQEGEVRPLGSNKKVKVDVRLVTASNRDLAQMVKTGKFRQDLFFRLNGISIKLPPLRERKEDIPLLVSHLVQKIAREFHLKPSEVANETYSILFAHAWPGNIRELEGVLRNAMLFAKGNPITPDLLSLHSAIFESSGSDDATSPVGEEAEERQLLIDSLRKHRLDKKAVASELGISLRTLYSHLERLGIPKKRTLLLKFLGLS